MTYDGAELAPCRKEKWRGGGGALASGLCELSCGVVVTFMAVPLPLVKNPWGKDHSWSQMHEGTAFHVPKHLLQSGLLGRRALQGRCCQHGTS